MGGSARIYGLIALVAIVPACDMVFGLDSPANTTPCGVFGEAEMVSIDPRLVNPVRLSFTHGGTGGLGVINARLDDMGVRRDVAVKWDDGAGAWMYDEPRSLGLEELDALPNLRHVVATQNEKRMFGSLHLDSDTKHHLFQLSQTTTSSAQPKWVQDGPEISVSTIQDSYAGKVLSVSSGVEGEFNEFLPVFRYDSAFTWSVSIAQHAAGGTVWGDATKGGRDVTQRINDKQWATGGSLIRTTEGTDSSGQVLFYSARSRGNGVGADLYFAATQDRVFLSPTRIDTLSTDQEDVEPWVDDACTTMTFRRVDPAGSTTNDDGDTITGGVIYTSTVIDGTRPTDGS